MSKDIWHSALEIPVFDDTVVFIDDLNNWHTGYTQRDNDGITDHDSGEIYTEENVLRWAYIKDLLALETELERTRKALDAAKRRLMQIGYLNMSEHGLGSEKMMTDWCKTVALHGLKEIETALEQKDVK